MKYLNTLLISCLITAASYAQNSAPSKQLTDKLKNLIDTYNTGDSAAYRKFYTSISNNEAHINASIQQTMREHAFIGKLKAVKTTALSSTETELVLKTDEYGSWWNLLWVTDSAQNYKEHHMRPVRLSSDFLSTGKLTSQRVISEVNNYITKLINKKVFAGNVFIAKGNNVLYSKSFGNNPQGLPNTVVQQFDLASMGKLFTTISILQLADQHKLSLDDSVCKLMPQLTNKALSGITVKQLLTHTSGMGDFFEDPAYDPMAGKTFTEADHLPAIEKDKPHFAPGKGFRYSNTGFLLLGLIVENVSGTSFSGYVENHIFNTAGMVNSKVGGAAGGGLSTIADLYNLCKAIRNSKLLSRSLTQEFLTYHNNNWGLGQEYQQLGNEVITGHSGGFIGVCTELNLYTNGYTVIILSNTEPPYGHFLSDKIKELLVRK